MKLIESSIKNPIPVFTTIFLVFVLGIISFINMPYQLTPSVDEPMVSVFTEWPGATPHEVEREIIEEQEKVLIGIPGMIEMESSANNGNGLVDLTFEIGTDVDQAMNRVSNKLNEVPYYPENVENPVVKRSGESQAPKIWMVLSTLDDNNRDINTYRSYLEDELLPELLSIDGVADIVLFGGAKSQMEVVVDLQKLASYGITISRLIQILKNENVNISAGIQQVGAKDYRIRTTAQFASPEGLANTVLFSDSSRTVYLHDVAFVKEGIARLKTYFRFDRMKDLGPEDSLAALNSPRYKIVSAKNGKNRWHKMVAGLDIGVKAEADANIIELTDKLGQQVEKLNSRVLQKEGLFLEIVYDERSYPLAALSIVEDNIIFSCILAVSILFIFLRNFSSTSIVAFVIPVTIVSTFIMMYFLGLSLNVVSLAGISFAVGMLIDNSIVVIENIERNKSLGKSLFQSSVDGARQVWPAVLASTLTTVAVFLPVVFLKQEAGQLFRDISIAVSTATLLSLFASVIVIPVLVHFFDFKKIRKAIKFPYHKKLKSSFNNSIENIGNRIFSFFERSLEFSLKNRIRRLGIIISILICTILIALFLIPDMEYLPQGNRNFLLNIIIPPAGTSYDEREQFADHFFKELEPYFGVDKDGFPSIEYTFIVGGEDLIFCGAQTTDEERCGELVPLYSRVANSYPGIFGISMQSGIFQNRLGRSRTVSLDISGGEQDEILKVAGILMNEKIPAVLKNSQIRAVPSLDVSYPEVRFIPKREALAANRLSSDDFGKLVDVMLDGRKIGDYKEEGRKKIDFVVKCSRSDIRGPEDIYSAIVPLPGGKSVNLFELANMDKTFGLTQIRHLNTKRTVTLEVNLPQEIPLEQAINKINDNIIPEMRNEGLLDNVEISSSGNSGKFTETKQALKWNIIIAVIILYFIMAIIFKHFLYPVIVMINVPLALAGGFIGLKFANILVAPTAFDIMTILGFIMLIGMVVNNPILIIHQSLLNIKSGGMNYRDAVIDAVLSRIKPIYMSVLTTFFGLLPLVLAPGAGSELYRGLGSVVLSGLFISTFFTVYLVPALLLLFVKKS